jgi:hypothetical protein
VAKIKTWADLMARIKTSLSKHVGKDAGLHGLEVKKGFNRWTKKRRVPKREKLIKEAFYNKGLFRIFARPISVKPAQGTSTTYKSADDRAKYQVFSDGSYRRLRTAKGRYKGL